MEKKQTAIEFLLKIMEHRHGMLLSTDIKQAKEIEKQQIKDAFYTGENTIVMTPEEYYNETYLK